MEKDLQERILKMFQNQNEMLLSMTKVIKNLTDRVLTLEDEVKNLKEKK